MKHIEDKIKWLANESKGIIEIRFVYNRWSINASLGNTMSHVPGTIADTIEEAVDKAISKWINRSEDNPFIF